MYTALVSVVIPCYNQGEFLYECINSVLVSTYKNIEIIVVDDGSTEPTTIDILKKIRFPHTRVVHQANKGLAMARNTGIDIAHGEYILPLDADDMIMPIFLEKAVAILEEDLEVGIVGGKTELFGLQSGIFNLPKYEKITFLHSNCLVCTHMFRKSDWEKVGGYNPNMKLGLEDWDFWLSLIEIGCKVYQFDDVLFRYRKHGVSMIGGMSRDDVKAMKLQAIDNHPRLYRWRGNYKYYVETGKRSLRGRILRFVLRLISLFVPVRRYRQKLRCFAKKIV